MGFNQEQYWFRGSADLLIVKQGMEQIQQRYAPLGFTFDNRLAAEAARLMENQS